MGHSGHGDSRHKYSGLQFLSDQKRQVMEQILKSWRTTILGLIVTFVGFMHFKGWISQEVFDFAFATLAGGGLIAAADGKQTEAAQAEAPDMLIILNEIFIIYLNWAEWGTKINNDGFKHKS